MLLQVLHMYVPHSCMYLVHAGVARERLRVVVAVFWEGVAGLNLSFQASKAIRLRTLSCAWSHHHAA